MKGGGGAATNSGINYQQRVSAMFLSACLTDYDISLFFNYQDLKNNKIKTLQLEGVDKIDDLILTLNDNRKIFCQIKRKLNLSDSKQSDFYKTLDQFIQQYLINNKNEKYFLITTSYTSTGIKQNLKKITDSIRLNNLAFRENPLNKSEQNTLGKYTKVSKNIFKSYTKRDMTDDEFIEFTKRVYIQNLDIENNSTMENAILVLLSTKVNTNSSILWEIMISNCLKYASQRMSISYDNICELYKDYLKEDIKDKGTITTDKEILKLDFDSLNIASGKEVFICKTNENLMSHFPEEKNTDYLVIELFRFDDECNKKIEFINNHCILADKTTSLELIYRTHSRRSVNSFIEDNTDFFSNKTIAILPAKNIDYVDSSPCAKLYSQMLVEKMKQNVNSHFNCIECGKAISENKSILVEIDEVDLINNIGLVHRDCLRPTIRVLGWVESDLFENHNLLYKFDWKLWIKKIIKGQGLFNQEIMNRNNVITNILWNSTFYNSQALDYCIKEYMVDDSINYVLRRGKVERFRKQDAIDGAIKMNNMLKNIEENNDYLCNTLKGEMSGTYLSLKDNIDKDDKLIKINKYEVEKVSNQIMNRYNITDNYYAPLLYISVGENQNYFSIDNLVVLLSNPLQLKDYLENWKRINIFINDTYEILILEDDKVFDNFMRGVYSNEMKAVVNPTFNFDNELVGGHIIDRFEL